MRDDEWDDVRNVLAIRLDNLGDVLMTTPALRALKASRPDRTVTLLASSIGAQAAPFIPSLDAVIRYDAPWMKATPARAATRVDREMVERIAAGRFDAAVVFTVCTQSPLPAAMLAYLAGIPLRLARCRENPYRLLSDWLPEDEASGFVQHEVERQVALVRHAVGETGASRRLEFAVPEYVRRELRARLVAAGLDPGRPWLVMHPGASAPSRRYPAEKYAAAGRILIRDHGVQIVLTGDAPERAMVEALAGAIPGSISLAGALSLVELAAVIEASSALVVNNTGPAHIAAAVGTPVVVLYALTNPQHTPWQVPGRVLFHDVPCRNCLKSICPEGHHHCLEKVPPEAVVDAALAFVRRDVRPPGFRVNLARRRPAGARKASAQAGSR